MSFSVKALADGQLASSKGTLYTTPAATQTIVKMITLFNSGAGTNICRIYIKPGATSRVAKYISLGPNEGLDYMCCFTLEAGDLIEGDATSATEVDYTLNGPQNA